ncbi:unnamed protein product [Ilex paraguariensis]|uniref:Uncharacterized protein n=1 Tax=Ilex paraguariensis TaxID=185542 RepID=A0ABC8R6U4_9AQUA
MGPTASMMFWLWLLVTISCKSANGGLETRVAGDVDKNGKFNVSLIRVILQDGELKDECFAQLHSASGALSCPRFPKGLEVNHQVQRQRKTNTRAHSIV